MTITGGGNFIDVLNLNLTTSSDIQVGFFKNVNRVIIKCRTSAPIEVRESAGSPDYYTIPSGGQLQLDMSARVIEGVVQPFNIWLRSGSGSVVAEVLGLYGG